MECLRDFIGIEGCGETASDSGFYVNRLLPGIPLESIDKIAQQDQLTYKEVWSDVQDRAVLRFENDVIRAFQDRYQIRSITESFDLLKFIDTTNNQSAAAAKWRGFTVELVQANNYRWVKSALQCINLQSIRIYRKAITLAVNAKVFNLETGEVLYAFVIPANASAGWTTVNINRRFFDPRIFIAFDSTLVACVSLDIQSDIINKYHDCMCNYYDTCEAVIRGAESASISTIVIDSDITAGNNLFGLSGVFSVGCSYNAIVCQNKMQFIMPWAFILGRELMWERVNSSRINRWTIGIDAEKAKKQMADFETAYLKELDTVIQGINLNQMDCCLECNSPVTSIESTM